MPPVKRKRCPTCKGRGTYLTCDWSGKDYDGSRVMCCDRCRAGLKLMLQDVETNLTVTLYKQAWLEKEVERLKAEKKSLKNRLRKVGC